MGQRARILTEIFGFDGWKVSETFFEAADGRRVEPVGGFAVEPRPRDDRAEAPGTAHRAPASNAAGVSAPPANTDDAPAVELTAEPAPGQATETGSAVTLGDALFGDMADFDA